MTSYATLRDNANSTEDGLTPTSTPLSPPTLELASSANNLANNTCMKKMNTPTTPGYDPDSFSESEREKMDSTPENIKKIDDVIDEEGQLRRDNTKTSTVQQEHHYNINNTPPCLSPRSEQSASFGLAAAVDDSNAKFCLAKPLCNIPKEMNVGSKSANKEITSSRDNKNDDEELSSGSARQEATTTSVKTKTAATNADNSNSEKEAHFSYDHGDGDESTSSNGNTTMTNSMKQSCAFTIDNFNDKECDAAAQAAKYKSMMERFQNRHRRGASMSKLENENESSASTTKAQTPTRLTSSQSSTPLTSRSSARNSLAHNDNNANSLESDTSATQKVKLRVRDRSTSRVRDASKRHSWSPRSSTNESNLQSPQSNTASTTTSNTSQSAMRKTTKTANKPPPIQVPKGSSNLVANRTQFTPRSTAMQLALKQVDFMCPQPPLADFKHLNADADDVSEAGTYTLDGDNYTEEQKDLMNIDKNGQPIVDNPRRTKNRPKQLDAITPTPRSQGTVESKRSNNVLEVNYYHDSEALEPRQRTSTSTSDLIMGSHQSAGAYLEKIKSRVLRNMNATKQMDIKQDVLKSSHSQPTDDEEVDPDLGCFTSVTTSGVLAKQRTLDARPKLSRHSGLSTSQIDSSEYVSNETKLKSSGTPASLAGGFTDHQKAEYRLNVFTNQKDASQKFAATRNLIETPPETPTGPQPTSKLSEVAVLQTAQTKHDWIQEWARNARARSLANDRHVSVGVRQANQDMLMTRSYTCADTGNESLTDDSLYSAHSKQFNAKLNRSLAERLRLAGNGSGECDYASDPSLTTSTSYSKPPKSPTKIPSPLHSLGRARSASRTRASLQNILPADDEDYLQQTAAAINNLQQSLSRKNSLKSPSHSASPRAHSARSHIMYSPEGTAVDSSPQHSLNAQRQRQAAQNLMTSSINEQQLQMLTSGEYLLRQMRMRKNSFDGNLAGSGSPHRRVLQGGGPPQVQSPTTSTAPDDQSSPLRRSSSFSARVAATQRAGRPNFQNLYTPPAARHSYGLSVAPQHQQQLQMVQAIKKSASSNNFGHVYSDYDDNLQYYINDEDDQNDMDEEYYSSGAEDNVEPEYYNDQQEQSEIENSVPLSNTRYNKALLMRIERSKQKVAGKPQSAPPTKPSAALSAAAGGVMACPNTPELPRRNVKSATTRSSVTSQRQSMPRDTSLSRLAQQVPSSLASAKKQLLQTAANVPSTTTAQRSTSSQRATPRYLDISKYKPAQSNQFLRKNDAKSTLKQPSNDIMKRSPSSSSMGLSRTDPSRASNRSVRSATSVMTTSGTSLGGGGSGRASSAVRRDASVSKQKEAEMAMWKRRSKYDPMKAAAEDRRKKEEAKRIVQAQQLGVVSMPSESERSLEQQWSIEETGDFDEDDCV
ncbi:uncharacterized protein LOC119603814 isoform X1 [Lucilia sericata]|uniref:uncharacterized protein LOC119603814 isoform X1 n=1 Tax=Lucilia sericata TaxID=13632 RepID=UPI0018A803FB|nr:uncharacterized protein LOC119603814 isoform X1 [Lucilia sericata]XP_037811935.1 uncharacterized protein LOC119603814 isoform X1 [Lucilia sericata]XP_037811937.1 uncharacterized protein LOC119603814 isoform X1 [Lucilia sericata]XP_037811938.1 uncharacterized protein LOC119603814 isoform X1 [Lucilia sericata]XP_037811939.1 uncharacterized protein LOC119603814 isoform X1 [Lucilia sericata]XP_037811940.1 uncharacterized protein LOC119603814 isoform X1 [Lucilia sericata]